MNTKSYPQPTVVEAPSGVLDPADAMNGATVRVTFVMEDTDLILLSWDGRANLVVPQPGNSSDTVVFVVPRTAVIDASGKTIQVLYTVIRSGAADSSIALDLIVKTVGPEVKPVILKVTGESGDVENGGDTPDNLLTIRGMAGSSVTLDVFDDSYPVESVEAESDGSWTLTLSGLIEKAHNFTAKTEEGQMSEAWALTVNALVPFATIVSVQDSEGNEIPHEGRTVSTSVTLRGKAQANQLVEIFDGVDLKGQIPANSEGAWVFSLPNMVVGDHQTTARASVSGGPVSRSWIFNVVAGIEDFDVAAVGSLPLDSDVHFNNGLIGRFSGGSGYTSIYPNSLNVESFGSRYLKIGSPGQAKFSFGRLITRFKFSYVGASGSMNAVLFYDSGDAVVQRHVLVPNNTLKPVDVDLLISSSCTYCVIEVVEVAQDLWALFDNFEWS